jgi:carboxypeptidase Q
MKKTTIRTAIALLLLQSILFANFASAQKTAVADINAQIRKEAMENSQIMRTIHFFTDVYGPRLTGSPNLKAAGEWAVKQMTTWGMENAALEPWDFGHPGWVNERASGFITAPVRDSLVFEVLAWTPGTERAVTGQAFQIILPERPTQEELTAYFNDIRAQIGGKMVLMGKPASIPVNFDPPSKRISDEQLKQRLDPNPAPRPTPAATPRPTQTPKPGQLTGLQIADQLDRFLIDNKVAVRINDAGREHGQIRAFNHRSFDITKTVPTVVMRNEDFGRISRLLASNTAVTLEFDIRNRTIPEGTTSYNTIGEIVGTDKKDEVIMLGGHLDSWHAATGATDNAVGCAIMMEAARILKTLNVKPRRTIRVALWSGEEQGLLGSQAYVAKNISARLKIRRRITRNSAGISTLIREPDALAECRFSARRKRLLFCVKLLRRLPIWASKALSTRKAADSAVPITRRLIKPDCPESA